MKRSKLFGCSRCGHRWEQPMPTMRCPRCKSVMTGLVVFDARQCEVRSELCNGEELLKVRLRIPQRVNQFEPTAKLACRGCRTFHWGAFKCVKGAA